MSQNITHTKPINPDRINAHCQFSVAIMKAINGGAATAPKLDPVLKMPKAIDLSLEGNHSETTFAEPGNAPPSPTPNRNLAMPRPITLDTKPWSMFARDHQIIIKVYPLLEPKTSKILPPTAYIVPKTKRKRLIIIPYSASSMGMDFLISLIATGRFCLSR